jgi:hypothetical protein
LVGESSGEPQFSRFRRLARSFILTRVVRNWRLWGVRENSKQ